MFQKKKAEKEYDRLVDHFARLEKPNYYLVETDELDALIKFGNKLVVAYERMPWADVRTYIRAGGIRYTQTFYKDPED